MQRADAARSQTCPRRRLQLKGLPVRDLRTQVEQEGVAIRDTSLGIGPILLGRIFDYVLQPSLSLVTRHVLTYTSCIYTCLSTP
jgi:hypothetical protein